MTIMQPTPDPRWVNILSGVGPDGSPLPMSFEALHDMTTEWERLGPECSDDNGVGALLRTARSLFEHAWFDHAFMAVACLIGFQAVEAAIRSLYPDSEKVPYAGLVNRAHLAGILTDELVERAKAGGELRNYLSHPVSQARFSVGMAAGMLETQHRLAALLTLAQIDRHLPLPEASDEP
jgi:hypothetical protein